MLEINPNLTSRDSGTVPPCKDFVVLTGVTSPDAHDDLTDVDTGDSAVGLAPGTTHTSLQSIGTGARQHLVDTDDMVRVRPYAEVETFLSGLFHEVPVTFAGQRAVCEKDAMMLFGRNPLVGADTRGLESLGAQLLILVGNQVNAEREVVDRRSLAAQVENSNLGVGHTAVKPRFGIRLGKTTMSAGVNFAW